ncbi:MAG: hemerythrin domain-containing protein [Loktanella sp.]|nr:hemerythrin domain-containing protein [Loktanella sp.]
MNDELALTHRDHLPDALRVLLAEYPREGWERDPGFDGLIRFWLDRHLMFRRLMKEMSGATDLLLDRKMASDQFASTISRYGGMFVNGLHEHHTIEDSYYFPKLMHKDKRISKGFDILDADHHALDEFLASFVTSANGALQASVDRTKLQDAGGAFQAELTRLQKLLNRHLVDEEELIVPVILRYGSKELG